MVEGYPGLYRDVQTYPKERIAFMLQDSRAPVLLTNLSLLPKLPAHERAQAESIRQSVRPYSGPGLTDTVRGLRPANDRPVPDAHRLLDHAEV